MSTSINARGHSIPPWIAQTPATGMEVGGTMATRTAGVGDYTAAISRDVADTVLFDLQLEEWLEAGIISYSAELAEYRQGRR